MSRENAHRNTNFDLTGLETFWKVLETFEGGSKPSRSDWRRLFSTPGYKALFQNDPFFRAPYLKKMFTLAYDPSKAKERGTCAENERDQYLLSHYMHVKERKDEIRSLVEGLFDRDVNGEARKAAFRYLPLRKVSNLDDPPVSFIIFKSDARGFSTRVVMDALAGVEWDDPFLLLAHEYHHYYRRQICTWDRDKGVDEGDKQVEIVLESVESEGIADLINRTPLFDKARPRSSRGERYIRLVEEAPQFIKAMDGILAVCSTMPDARKDLARGLLEILPDGGHQVGFFMARAIEKGLGRKSVVDCVGDPFRFFATYSKVVSNPGSTLPAFSERTTSFVESLRGTFMLKSPD
jgi:hypothetical protein